jgi:hypothetical protein
VRTDSNAILADATAIRLQLERLLASSQLRNSKRSQALLKYVIEAALDGSAERIKERTIGVEVFGRDPDYDTNQDSVVRNAAIEVRKRLAQYYLEPEHETELRIVLPQGGYVPEFQPGSPAVETPALRQRSRKALASAAVAIALLCMAAVWLLHAFGQSDLDRFWGPLVKDRAPVLVCVGQPVRLYGFTGPRRAELDEKVAAQTPEALEKTTLNLRDIKLVGTRYLFFGDTVCMIRLCGLLQAHGKAFQVRGATTTPYQDLRGNPAVLIGAFNNQWTQRLTGNLRFYFVRLPEQKKDELRDRQNPNRQPWEIPGEPRSEEMFDDYAIVSRILDGSTEKAVISIAGVTQYGTQSAGDFVTSEDNLRQAFHDAPPGWWRKNVQLILKTRVVTGAAGPARVVATHFW